MATMPFEPAYEKFQAATQAARPDEGPPPDCEAPQEAVGWAIREARSIHEPLGRAGALCGLAARLPGPEAAALFDEALAAALPHVEGRHPPVEEALDHLLRHRILTTLLPEEETHEGLFSFEAGLSAMHGEAAWPGIDVGNKDIDLVLGPGGRLYITHQKAAPGTPYYLAFSAERRGGGEANWPTPFLRVLFEALRLRGEQRVEALVSVARGLLPHPVRDDLLAHAEVAARALLCPGARRRGLGLCDAAREAVVVEAPVPPDERVADERFVMLRKSGAVAGAVVVLGRLPFAGGQTVRVIFKRALPPEVWAAPEVVRRSLVGLARVDPAAAGAWRDWLRAYMVGHPRLEALLDQQ